MTDGRDKLVGLVTQDKNKFFRKCTVLRFMGWRFSRTTESSFIPVNTTNRIPGKIVVEHSSNLYTDQLRNRVTKEIDDLYVHIL